MPQQFHVTKQTPKAAHAVSATAADLEQKASPMHSRKILRVIAK